MDYKKVITLFDTLGEQGTLLLSERFHDIAEELEDIVWVKKNKNKIKREEYVDASVLDSVVPHARPSQQKVSQRTH